MGNIKYYLQNLAKGRISVLIKKLGGVLKDVQLTPLEKYYFKEDEDDLSPEALNYYKGLKDINIHLMTETEAPIEEIVEEKVIEGSPIEEVKEEEEEAVDTEIQPDEAPVEEVKEEEKEELTEELAEESTEGSDRDEAPVEEFAEVESDEAPVEADEITESEDPDRANLIAQLDVMSKGEVKALLDANGIKVSGKASKETMINTLFDSKSVEEIYNIINS